MLEVLVQVAVCRVIVLQEFVAVNACRAYLLAHHARFCQGVAVLVYARHVELYVHVVAFVDEVHAVYQFGEPLL